ncbi:MAG: lipoyl(octanoyl) transferase LipB [Planctomycetes bacterium]|nr:lipoyl(octanoyl) transferase LipB [Planctomycetota bacterium]MCC8115704.1 lipoyl(octanoyl) transferase LipB [Planctomycetota bacterium]MCD7895599.1 lipoyl(octanoyl) transferase LipB [Planctomycetaceae bacterium]
MPHPATVTIRRNLAYAEGVAVQKDLVAGIANDPDRPGTVMFAEHRPVITCGRSGDGSNLLVRPEALAADGIEYHQTNRGGDVTYHGPGQWTVYPILRLAWYEKNLHRYLRLLEECVIHFLHRYGLEGTRRQGLTGAWVGTGKVAAVGVAVTRWVTWHGIAVNINPNLDRFTRYMHPCGIRSADGGVASLSSLLGTPYTLEDTLTPLMESIAEVLSLDLAIPDQTMV